MKYRILMATNTFDGKVTWRVQYKFLCFFWCYLNHYQDPFEFKTRENAESYIRNEMKNDARIITKVVEIFQYAK